MAKGNRPRNGVKRKDDYDKILPSDLGKSIEQELPEEKDTIREAISEMLTGNLGNLTAWLTKLGETNPEKALTIFNSFAEFVMPKQQREGGKSEDIVPITINFEPASNRPIPAKKDKPEQPITSIKKFSLDDIIRS
jgi:hypothetical protein